MLLLITSSTKAVKAEQEKCGVFKYLEISYLKT